MTLLCYADPPTGVHLTADGHRTLCGKCVKDIPTFPRVVEPLACKDCKTADTELAKLVRKPREEV